MKRKRVLAISDIHGEYDMFVKLLEKVNYSPSTCDLYLLGDYVDKGLHSRKVIDLIMKLVDDGAKAVIGNHDFAFLKWLDGDNSKFHSSSPSTLNSYVYNSRSAKRSFSQFDINEGRRYIRKHYMHHIKFLRSLPYYLETEDHIFVHAGYNSKCDDWKKETKTNDFMWLREKFYRNPTNVNKMTVFGHTTCRRLHKSNDPWFDLDKIGIDGGASDGGQLNCLEILGDYEYIVHKVTESDVRKGGKVYA